MIRRDFLLGCAAVTFPARALAQPALRKIGFVSWFTPEVAAHAETFRKGMRDLGYVEGRDFTVEVHFTSGARLSDPHRSNPHALQHAMPSPHFVKHHPQPSVRAKLSS